MSILVIDNEDSFTYNIVDILRKFENVEHMVVQSKAIEIDFADNFEKIIISPGPGLPIDFPAGCSWPGKSSVQRHARLP